MAGTARATRTDSEDGKKAVAVLSKQLLEDFETILTEDFKLALLDDSAIAPAVIWDVVDSTFQAMEDMRHQYPYSITIIKFISNLMFWTMRLKPISSCGLLDKGDIVNVPDINEHLAIYWGMHKITEAVKTGQLLELVNATPETIDGFRKVVVYYLSRDLYKNLKTGEPIRDTRKYNETVYYSRYKKTTAVNIYEVIMHLIVAYKAVT